MFRLGNDTHSVIKCKHHPSFWKEKKIESRQNVFHCSAKIIMNQIQVWQLYTDTSLLYTWELSYIITVWPELPYKPTIASSCNLLYRRLEGSWWCVKPESRAVSSQRKHQEKVQVMCLFLNTFSILQEDIHCLVFRCLQGGPEVRVSHRLAPLQGGHFGDMRRWNLGWSS